MPKGSRRDKLVSSGRRDAAEARTEETASTADRSTRDAVAKARLRRQALLRGRPRSRVTPKQQWLFVLLVLVIALAWLFGRDACTRSLSSTYDTLASDPATRAPATPPQGSDASSPAGDSAPDDDW